MHYGVEEFTESEEEILRRYFTNLDSPVFALVNLPEVVKGALFARYSRSPKSLRRLFLDEFVGELDVSGDISIDATVGLRRAEDLYDKVFMEYGDDSVAQLGGVHLACEQASNLLTKILERGRLMSYLEQSTRYIPYTNRNSRGHYLYYRDPAIVSSGPLGARYVGDMDRIFETYAELIPKMQSWFQTQYPKEKQDSDFVYRQSIRAKALDAVRGLLPAASLSNVGIYASGQAFEMLLLRMRAHPLAEARSYAVMMLDELRKVIPSFLKRVDLPDRGGAWSAYMETNRKAMQQLADTVFGGESAADAPVVRLVDFDPEGEDKAVAAMLYPYSHLPEEQILARVRAMPADEKASVVAAYVGERTNRRHKPGRGLERVSYRFDILADYGAFRDLQRHRMLTIDWQDLSPRHGYSVPDGVVSAGLADAYDATMARSGDLYDAIDEQLGPTQAAYAVSLGYRVRFVMQCNARSAMHLTELRSSAQGHPDYRRVAQEMHRLIRDEARHPLIAEMMSFVDYDEHGLERIDAERRAASRRAERQ